MLNNTKHISDIRSKDELIAFIGTGHEASYLFFWGHTAKDKSVIGKECLSQWYPAVFALEGINYSTAEHYMMAEKARLFNDNDALDKILNAKTPADAKKLGGTVKDYDDIVWKEHRFNIVVTANKAKFSQHKDLKSFLVNTGDKILVEASPRDRIWGIGMGQSNADAQNPAKWRGLNLLGFALMQARQFLKSE